MRKKKARRNDPVGESESGHSEESWGEIRSHLGQEPKRRTSREEPERRRTGKRSSLDSARSARKRNNSRNSPSSHDSGTSVRRPTDLPQHAKTRYKNEHSRDLPPFLQQTFPRATGHPLSLKCAPTLLPEGTKQRGEIDKAADFILSLQGEKAGHVEADHSKVVEWAVFALRGFGEFQVRWGIGAYGRELNACIRRLGAYENEEILASGVRCVMSNRIAYGFSTFKIGTCFRGKEDNKTATSAD